MYSCIHSTLFPKCVAEEITDEGRNNFPQRSPVEDDNRVIRKFKPAASLTTRPSLPQYTCWRSGEILCPHSCWRFLFPHTYTLPSPRCVDEHANSKQDTGANYYWSGKQ